MTRDDIIRLAREADKYADKLEPCWINEYTEIRDQRFAELAAAVERKALETAVLKLKSGVAGPRDYIQGRWDAIGEVQDIIRARGEK